MSRGYFITFEGGEGTGKSTQLMLVDEWLRTLGHTTVVTREPGGTRLAEAVRALLLDPELEPDGYSEIFLLEAARRDHVERVIRPAIEDGAVVLCDRFTDSSLVYQGVVRGLGWEEVAGRGAKATPAAELETEALAGWSAEQVAAIRDLEAPLREQLERDGLLELFEQVELPLTRVLGRVERAGVRIDEERLRALSDEYEGKLSQIEARIFELAG